MATIERSEYGTPEVVHSRFATPCSVFVFASPNAHHERRLRPFEFQYSIFDLQNSMLDIQKHPHSFDEETRVFS